MQHTWLKSIFVLVVSVCLVLFNIMHTIPFRKVIVQTGLNSSRRLIYPPPRQKYFSNGNFSVRREHKISDFNRHISPNFRKLIGEEILQSVPQTFNSRFVNPCWYDNTQSLRCLPYFYVAGMPKSGTTDLMSKINLHPDVVPSSRKEINWWTRYRYVKRNRKESRNFNWYLRNFDLLAKKLTIGGRRISKLLITGDGSASTFWDNHNTNENDVSSNFTHSDIIHEIQPNAKIIAIFRNPSDRLYSGYKYFNRNGYTSPELFHLFVTKAIKLFNNCLLHQDIMTCINNMGVNSVVRLQVGIYNIFVRDWLRVFPREQLYFFRTDEWRNCTLELPKLYNFLTLRSLSARQITSICNQRKKNMNTGGYTIGPMLQETRKLLDEFYKPFMKDLAEALEDTRYNWDYA